MLSFLFNFLFPKRSLSGMEGSWITQAERQLLRTELIVIEKYALQKMGVQSLDRLVAAGMYAHAPLLQKAIHTCKYRGVKELADDLGELLLPASYLCWSDDDHPVLCPVPLHWIRLWERGFNQAELLGRAIGGKRGCDVQQLLRRKRSTGRQAHRKRDERFLAMQNAFEVSGSITIPWHVVLIDDVATSGATLDACASVLKSKGAERVMGLVVAKG